MRTSWKPKDIGGVPDGLVLFDGVCVLCSRWVRFLIEHDSNGYFKFTPIQSPDGLALARELGINPETPETNAIVMGGRAYFKGDFAIHALTRVPRWQWVRGLSILPRSLRDWLYDRIARNRYRLFGKTESCMIPRPEVLSRFVLDKPSVDRQPKV